MVRDSKNGRVLGGAPALRPRGGRPYAPTSWLFQGDCAPRLAGGSEEIIVAATFTKYTARRDSADRACRPAALRRRSASSARYFAAAPRCSAGLCRSYEPEAERVGDATPMKKSRDAMISTTPGFVATSFLPHSTASPAALKAAAAARPGVLPEWQSACLSTPPTPRRLG